MSKLTLDFSYPHPPKNYKISSAFSYNFKSALTVEKSAEILVKVRSMQPYKRQTIQPDDFRRLAVDFNVELPEKFLYEKH